MSSLLPKPQILRDIILIYGLNKFFTSKRNLIGKNFSIDTYLNELRAGKVIQPHSISFDRMNMYFLNRSMHQTNEACNKLWSTIELLYSAKSDKRLCKKFCEDFASSSAVPTLHYANISSILSILSLFGVASVINRDKRLTFYNVIRTAKGMIMIERNKYLKEVFGSVKTGWHVQVLQTYAGLSERGIMLPNIDIDMSHQLLKERSKFHYDILGQTNMHGVYDIENYFRFLPTVVTSIDLAIKGIQQIVKPLPNGCDSRFKEIVNNIPTMLQIYKMKS